MGYKMIKVILFSFLLFSTTFAQASSTKDIGFVFKVGKSPFIMQENIMDIATNSNADKSPCKSLIYLNQPQTKDIMTYTIAAFSAASKFNVELSIYSTSENPISGIEAELGYRPIFELNNLLTWHFCINGTAARFSGIIGEVGERDGDNYLEAPDGKFYYTGSNILVEAISYGVSLSAGLDFMLTKNFGLTTDLGYRFVGNINRWDFQVTTDSDDDDDGQSSDLPRSGFEQQPSSLKLSGFYARAGLVLYL